MSSRLLSFQWWEAQNRINLHIVAWLFLASPSYLSASESYPLHDHPFTVSYFRFHLHWLWARATDTHRLCQQVSNYKKQCHCLWYVASAILLEIHCITLEFTIVLLSFSLIANSKQKSLGVNVHTDFICVPDPTFNFYFVLLCNPV